MYNKPSVEILGNAASLVQSLKQIGSEIDPNQPDRQAAELSIEDE